MLNNIELAEKLHLSEYKYILAIFTDKADFIDAINDFDNLLEVRAFDENGEFRAYRDVISSEFKWREIINDEEYDGYFDQTQYLDIDSTKCLMSDTEKITTGGGKYHLPKEVTTKTMLNVRYYYCFDDNGIARKCDWRLVGFSDLEV